MKNRIVKQLVLAVALCAVPLSTVGCGALRANPQPGVANFYPQTALVLNDFAGLLDQATPMIDTAYKTGAMPLANYKGALETLQTIGQKGQAIVMLAKAGGDSATITAQITALSSSVASMPAAFGIKDPNSAAAFSALVTSMTSLLSQSITLASATK